MEIIVFLLSFIKNYSDIEIFIFGFIFLVFGMILIHLSHLYRGITNLDQIRNSLFSKIGLISTIFGFITALVGLITSIINFILLIKPN